MINTDDIAFGIVENLLLVGPKYFEIEDAVFDLNGSEKDVETVALVVRSTLNEIARTFSLTY